MTIQQIAFIGLGNMGAPMALNLLKAGRQLQVFDVSADAVAKAVAAGGAQATSAVNAVANADIVITMLPNDALVQSVYLGDANNGILSAMKADALAIDCSTISPQAAQAVASAASARGIRMLDAPVSGGTGGAAAGTLTFIVGGAAADLEVARPVLEQMGKNIFHAGAAGMGQAAKICNNMLLGICMAGTAEALTLGTSLGLDPAVLSNIIAKSSGRNWATELYNPYPGVMENVPASKGYAGGFGSMLMLKDLGLAMHAALSTSHPTPLGSLARNLYADHVREHAAKDFSSITLSYDPKIGK